LTTTPSEATHEQVRYIDRISGREEREPVVAEGGLRWLYGGSLAARLARGLARRRWVSTLYGKLQDRPGSRRKIASLVRDAAIDASEAEHPPEHYDSLNAFFARRLAPGARPLVGDPEVVLSPADARVLAWQELADGHVPVKGGVFPVEQLVGGGEVWRRVRGGAVIVLRLAPGDYHRFHFPASGVAGPSERLPGPYDSVNPLALALAPRILSENERQRSQLDTERFGTLAIVEVGALFVGRIVQTYAPGPVERGDEKGYFQFGGSTVVLACEPGRVTIDEDLLRNTERGLETRLRMGTSLGRATPAAAGV
jgi:phosphatidylserine decarboxylase